MELRHLVWAAKPGSANARLVDDFPVSGWQFAEKLARKLRDKGFDAAVTLEEIDFGEDDDYLD